MIRKINLYGGAGSGKSTLQTQLYSELKKKGHDIELVREWIKPWAYEGKKPDCWDQNYINASQMYEETKLLKYVNYIITDAPVLLGAAYAYVYKSPFWEQLTTIAKHQEASFPPINIWVDRDHAYQTQGRYESEQDALDREQILYKFVSEEVECMRVKSTINVVELSNTISKLLNENYEN